jgi:hypothetical protein
VPEKNNPKIPPAPKPGTEWATAEQVQKFLDRAKRILLLYMPVSKTIH